jgi:excisionase family DNA binding protein
MSVVYCPLCGRNTQVLTINEACQMVGRRRRTIYNWINAGKLHLLRSAGGRMHICADSLLRPYRNGPPEIAA